MKIGILTWGSAGDLNPFIGLAAGLRRCGHEITMFVRGWRLNERTYERTYEQHGFTCEWVSLPDPASISRERDERRWTERFLTEHLLAHDDATFDAAARMADTCDALVSHHLMSYPVKAAAIRTGTPLVLVTLNPSSLRSGPGGRRARSSALSAAGARRISEHVTAFWRRHGCSDRESLLADLNANLLSLVPVSKTLVEQHRVRDRRHVVTGFMEAPAVEADCQVDPALAAFLDAGDPPVLMTFGTAQHVYPGADPFADTALLLAATHIRGSRALVQVAPRSMPSSARVQALGTSPDVLVTGWLPYEHVLPRCAAVVHQGGMGITHLVTKHGRPSVVVPFVREHAYWAGRLRALGAAPPPLRRARATPAKLANLVERAASQAEFARRAGALARALHAEDGVASAVRAINERLA